MAEKLDPKYDRLSMKNSLTLSSEEVKSIVDSGQPYVIRLKVPDSEIKFTDIFYEDLVASPLDVLERIYHDGLSSTSELNRKFLETDRKNAPNRYGTHVYKLEDFGINLDELNASTHHYIDFINTIRG